MPTHRPYSSCLAHDGGTFSSIWAVEDRVTTETSLLSLPIFIVIVGEQKFDGNPSCYRTREKAQSGIVTATAFTKGFETQKATTTTEHVVLRTTPTAKILIDRYRIWSILLRAAPMVKLALRASTER
ncbi:hypothetical protein J6590_055910 [Homalodisca vitripennis]|nr:hypothetical protein J6590_055910 [Homalodisca vitripennis]